MPLKRVGVEMAFLPMDAEGAADALPGAELKDALLVLERLRAVKSADELAKLKTASELVIASMLEVIAAHGPGTTKQQLSDSLRVAEANRGLTFEYCLLACGSSHNRAPSIAALGARRRAVARLRRQLSRLYRRPRPHGRAGRTRQRTEGLPGRDRGGSARRLCRGPTGALGGDIYVAAERQLAEITQRDCTDFLAHGMGLVSHEAPRLTAKGPVPYDDTDARLPLETGMVVSIETTMKHPKRGFIKLEDTVVVTATGYEIFGEGGRGWNLGGSAL